MRTHSALSEAGEAAAIAIPASVAVRLAPLVARLRFFKASDSVPFLLASLNLSSKEVGLLCLSVLAGGVLLAVIAASVGRVPVAVSAGDTGSLTVSLGVVAFACDMGSVTVSLGVVAFACDMGYVTVFLGVVGFVAATAGATLGGVSGTVITGMVSSEVSMGVALTQYGPSFMMSAISFCFVTHFFACFMTFAGANP